jgi:hypothetical protein
MKNLNIFWVLAASLIGFLFLIGFVLADLLQLIPVDL